jgi:hypothetical protein
MRQLQRRCEALVADLEIPVPFDLEALCATLGARRGRPVVIVAQGRPTGGKLPCGMWVELVEENLDVIFIDPTTSPLHRRQIGLHEFAHILCNHGKFSELDEDDAELARTIDPAIGDVTMAMGRSSYDDDQELEAEMIATLLAERIVLAESGPTLAAGSDAVLEELRRALGGRGPGPRR